MSNTTYTSENEGYGYHGTLISTEMLRREQARLFDLAARTLLQAKLTKSEEETLEFLDSRMGRGLGDSIAEAKNDTEMQELILKHAPAHLKHYRQA